MSARSKLTRRQRLNLAATLACVVLFYFWTATTCGWIVRPAKHLQFYYNHLSHAFIGGQLSLQLKPSPELLALPDPYDPVQNRALRMHDAVLYQGKYYLYYGPTPALVLFIPFQILTGVDISEPLAVATFCSMGLVYAYLLFLSLCRRYWPDTSFGWLLAAVPAIGFGNVAPFILRRPLHYEVAIAAGYAFTFASLYYVVNGCLGEHVNRRRILLGSLLLGLAGGARFPMFGAGLILMVLAAYVIWTERAQPIRDHVMTALAFFAPVSVCLFLLALYNHARFDSWTEFGMRYTLQGIQSARTYTFYSLARVPAGLFYYLLVPPRFLPQFPFVRADPMFYMVPPPDYVLERVTGILPTIPLLGSLLFAPLCWPALRRRSHLPLYLVMGAMVVVGLVLLWLYCLSAGTMRYEMDFVSFLLIPALLVWYGCLHALPARAWRRKLLTTAFTLALVATVVLNGALSLTGYYDDLQFGSPDVYDAIHNVFRPLETLLGPTP